MTAKSIKNLRMKLGLTQKQMGELVGVDAETIHRWEARKTQPRDLSVYKLEQLEAEHESQ